MDTNVSGFEFVSIRGLSSDQSKCNIGVCLFIIRCVGPKCIELFDCLTAFPSRMAQFCFRFVSVLNIRVNAHGAFLFDKAVVPSELPLLKGFF